MRFTTGPFRVEGSLLGLCMLGLREGEEGSFGWPSHSLGRALGSLQWPDAPKPTETPNRFRPSGFVGCSGFCFIRGVQVNGPLRVSTS